MAREFPFSDLHSFKDYVGFVKLCAPEDFPLRDYGVPADQWTLESAFDGLRYGLRIALNEDGMRDIFALGAVLVDEAYDAYRNGRLRDGFLKLEELQTLLKRIPSS